MSLSRTLAVAADAAEAAGRMLVRALGRPRRIRHKAEVDLVTDADLAAETELVRTIRAAFPEDAVVTEESGPHGPASSRRWIIDPLDGTTNFAHGAPHVAVSIALEVEGVVVMGLTHDPFRHETFGATRGTGAHLNGRAVTVSTVHRLDDALVATGFPYDRRVAPQRYLVFVDRVLRASQGVRRAGSAALDLAWLAAGRYDGFWEWKLAPWDVAAGRLLVEEAGGHVSTADGDPHALDAPSIVATNGLLHEALLRALAWDGRVP